MNARHWLLVCLIALVACGDDDAGQVDAGIDCGIRDAMPDSPIDAMPDSPIDAACVFDANEYVPNDVAEACAPCLGQLGGWKIEGACLGAGRTFDGSCVTEPYGGISLNGELLCFIGPEGDLYAGFVRWGEYVRGGDWDYGGGSSERGFPSNATDEEFARCADAMSALDWSLVPTSDDGGLLPREALPFCDPGERDGG